MTLSPGSPLFNRVVHYDLEDLMTNTLTKAASKKKAVQEFEALLKKTIANMGDPQKLLLLTDLNASIEALVKDQARAMALAKIRLTNF